MKVNGKESTLSSPTNLLVFLQDNGYNPTRVAVERNGAIVPRAMFGDIILSDDDTLEVVTFVGGG